MYWCMCLSVLVCPQFSSDNKSRWRRVSILWLWHSQEAPYIGQDDSLKCPLCSSPQESFLQLHFRFTGRLVIFNVNNNSPRAQQWKHCIEKNIKFQFLASCVCWQVEMYTDWCMFTHIHTPTHIVIKSRPAFWLRESGERRKEEGMNKKG